MNYECKRCGKKAKTRSGLRCGKCDIQESQLAGAHMIYPTPPGSDETREIKSDNNDFSGTQRLNLPDAEGSPVE